MPHMILNRDANCFEGVGTVNFKPGIPSFVPDYMVSAAMAMGAMPAEGERKAVEKAVEVAEAKAAAPIGSLRGRQIKAVLEEIKSINNPEEFTATGFPTAAAVASRLGYDIDRKERETAWKELIGA